MPTTQRNRSARENELWRSEAAALILPEPAIGEAFRAVESLEELTDINELVGILTS